MGLQFGADCVNLVSASDELFSVFPIGDTTAVLPGGRRKERRAEKKGEEQVVEEGERAHLSNGGWGQVPCRWPV